MALNNPSQMQTTKKLSIRPSLLLKDYLRDDLSSCSSSGFKSLPRRQCCTTVKFLLEKDLKRRNITLPPPTSSSKSVLRKASEAVINVIKSLPLSQKSTAKAKKASSGILSRSLSRKLLSRSFWRKTAKEEGRRSFRELLMEERDDKATSLSVEETVVFTAPSRTTSSSGCESNSWGESEFTFSSSAASSESSAENDVAEGTKEGAPHHKIEPVTRDWTNEEKEQFSPVSVLDCPFEDDEEITLKFNSTTRSLLEGNEHKKHIKKRRYLKSVASLEPVELEKRIACAELENELQNHSPKYSSELVPIMCDQIGNNGTVEESARNLLDFFKSSIPPNCLINKAENLLFDYFKQSIGENNDIDHSMKVQLCKVAEDWLHGQPQELYLGWEVQKGREIFVREMDQCGEWKNSDKETHELGLELENEVFTSLVNELLIDITTC